MLNSKVSDIKKHLIIEVLPSFHQVSFLSYNNYDKKIEVERSSQFKGVDDLKVFLKKLKRKDDYSIILSLDSEFASTTYSCQQIIRKDPKQVIDVPELESLMSRLIWRNLPISQIHIRRLTIDGHRVVNPIGLTGKNVTIYFSKTSANEKFLADFKEILPTDKLVLIAEAGCLWSHIVSQIHSQPKKPFILIPIYYDKAPVFLCKEGDIKYLKTLAWGEKNLISTLFGNLAVAQESAREILEVYCKDEMSNSLTRKVNAFWDGEFKNFTADIEKILTKEKINHLYLLPFFNFPFKQTKFKRGTHAYPVDNSFISQKLGFKLKLNSRLINDFATISALVELDYIPINNLLNKIANRRLRWYEYGRTNQNTY